MTRLIRWLLALVVGLGAVVAAPAVSSAASSSASSAASPLLDGVQLRYLPPGLGTSTDFEYEYDDVAFVARVWESGSDAAGWRVDLDVEVLRGDRLSRAQELHDWFIAYEARPASEVGYRPVRIGGRPGWVTRDEVFWLVRPGLAMAVSVDAARYSQPQLLRTARQARVR